MKVPNFLLKPIPRPFFRYQIFRSRDFFPIPIFFETETDTFFRDQIFRNPKPRLFSETKLFRSRNRDIFSETKLSETETLKNLAKVSRLRPKPRLLNIFWCEIWKFPRLFSKTIFFQNRDFFPKPNFSKPKSRLFFRDQIFRNRNPQKIDKSSETEKFRNWNVNLWWSSKSQPPPSSWSWRGRWW